MSFFFRISIITSDPLYAKPRLSQVSITLLRILKTPEYISKRSSIGSSLKRRRGLTLGWVNSWGRKNKEGNERK